MRIVLRDELAQRASHADIIEALRKAFRSNFNAPPRHHHQIKRGSGDTASFLLMPSWTEWSNDGKGGYAGLKTVMVFPDNPRYGRPTIQANYLLFSIASGETLALMDGSEITVRRTAAASALAADYLARPNAATLLMVGAGALAPHVVKAHASVRPIRRVLLWNRSRSKAEALAQSLRLAGFSAECPATIEEAVTHADIISCATTSREPIIRGRWVKPGTHIDLMGAFKPEMREADGEAIGKARVFVDTYEGAMSEAGDLLQAIKEGSFSKERIEGDLAALCRGSAPGRKTAEEITLFKSCGTAIEDLATAIMVYEKVLSDSRRRE
ncbi:MAG TPA: ornithine cyclodeaminase family protein [Aestuariivirgaceae bacterium]|nr:ornithine cyclodeaminase family protein [Aestuariivirgaceae bacterium]